jgi:uncharacterized protein YecE (DUF72 family)
VSRIRVGICSWADPALIESGGFYPKKSMTAEARLKFYARFFDTVEVNSSYYAIPDVRNTARWVERTPSDFVFHVKAYALLTGHHVRSAALPADVEALLPASPRRTPRGDIDASAFPPEAIDAAFWLFRRSLAPLAQAGKLGYVLFQLAPWVRFAPRWLEYLATLPARMPGFRLAVEFRDRSWLPDHTRETLAVLRDAGIAHVVVDAPGTPNAVPRLPVATAPLSVFRLHGRNVEGWLRQLRGDAPAVREKYDYLYTDGELAELKEEAEAMTAHADDVVISFNNNNRDYPVRNALAMKRMLGQPTPGGHADSLPRDLFA